MPAGLLGGGAFITSHDRWVLDRVATHILAFEGDSRVVWFEGNYEDYDADRRRRPASPHQVQAASAVGTWVFGQASGLPPTPDVVQALR